MRVLVVHGSKRGSTAGLAEMVGTALEAEGVDADVRPARTRGGLDGYDAVIVGGALYANRWQRHARRFVKRQTRALRNVPVFFFSSGPLDDSAAEGDIAPTKQVTRLMERVDARGHATFGGALAPDAKGFPASAMAKEHAGDWRDPDHVRRWVAEVLHEVQAHPVG